MTFKDLLFETRLGFGNNDENGSWGEPHNLNGLSGPRDIKFKSVVKDGML